MLQESYLLRQPYLITVYGVAGGLIRLVLSIDFWEDSFIYKDKWGIESFSG